MELLPNRKSVFFLRLSNKQFTMIGALPVLILIFIFQSKTIFATTGIKSKSMSINKHSNILQNANRKTIRYFIKYLPLLIVSLLSILFYQNLSSQNNSQYGKLTPKNHQLSVLVGANQGFVKDANFSALNYSENGLLYALKYVKHKSNRKSFFQIDIDYSDSDLTTITSEHFTSLSTLANVEISYLRKLKQPKNEQLTFYLGGQYFFSLQILDWLNFEAFSFTAVNGIGLKGHVHYNINKKSMINSSLFIPLIQNLSRPPYNGIDEFILKNEDNSAAIIFAGEIATINKYLGFDWSVNYSYSLFNHFNIITSYTLRYKKLPKVNKMIHLQNQITVGLTYKF